MRAAGGGSHCMSEVEHQGSVLGPGLFGIPAGDPGRWGSSLSPNLQVSPDLSWQHAPAVMEVDSILGFVNSSKARTLRKVIAPFYSGLARPHLDAASSWDLWYRKDILKVERVQ